ncbi:hypothetical protein M2132_001957 [Dysgonomonas sp. PH5-45]|nr:hypothetical protein [Dysgonomonas sp. PH5-45]MDH6388478.1 hypothetical protein [Dysgonomonas sp. PH5-37]
MLGDAVTFEILEITSVKTKRKMGGWSDNNK